MEDEPEDTGAFGDMGLGDLGAADSSAWGADMDLDFSGVELKDDIPVVEERHSQNVTMSDSLQTKWLRKRKLPADLVAAGEFEEALNLLKRRLGVINADPLKPLFQAAYWATCSALPGVPNS